MFTLEKKRIIKLLEFHTKTHVFENMGNVSELIYLKIPTIVY